MNNSRHKVLAAIRRLGPVGQASIAKTVGLSLPAVMTTVRRLVDMGMVREVGVGDSTGGKPPKLLEFVKDSYYSVGVDIGATGITCVLMDGADIVSRGEIPNPFERGPDHVLEHVIGAVDTLLSSSNLDRRKLLGIGVASPGLFDPAAMFLEYSPLLGWRGVDFVTPLRARFNTYVCADNSVRVTLYGERIYGSAKTSENFMCVNLGHGIGCAMVFGDEVYAGNCGSAGEIGHIVVKPDGPPCNCGKRGCLEAVASARAIVRDAEEKMRAGEAPILRDLADAAAGAFDAKLVFGAARMGDAACLNIVRGAMRTIGDFIGGIINFLDLELIILEGGLSQAGPEFLGVLEEAANAGKMGLAGRGTRILVSELGLDATVVGAAAMVVALRLEGDRLFT